MPFRNLKMLIVFSKALGFFSCKLMNGQLKSSSVWSCCFCMIWFFIHCTYTGFYFYDELIKSSKTDKKEVIISIVRYSAFTASLLPFNLVAAFWSKNIVKLSNILLTYDEEVIILGHQRKDKHIFTYLFFVYMCIIISWKYYYDISDAISEETGILSVLESVIPRISGSYSVYTTCIFLDLIRQRFRHLNEIIIPQVSELPVTGSHGEITVYKVRYLHGVLLDGAELINSLYGIAILFTFISILLDFVFHIYSLIKDLKANTTIGDNFLNIADLFFVAMYMFAMYHFTTYEVNRVENRVIQYGLSFQNKKCRMDKIEILLYFYHRRYFFTAAQFFPLDITILFPIVTAVTTYLTLIV